MQTKSFQCVRVLVHVNRLKVGYVIFQKRFRKLSGGPVLKQTCSQSAVRGVSTHDAEERALSAHDGH